MKKNSRIALLLATFITIGITIFAQDLKINPADKKQTIEGWGASLCWWANLTGRWTDEDKIDSVITLITSPEYLNYNVFRYNIGGGDDPSHYTTSTTAGHMTYGKGQRAEMDGFLAGEDAEYDWTKDPGQQKILWKLNEAREDAIFEAFSNSAPYWMTNSGCSAGNDPADEDNLNPDYYDAFCDYLVTVCEHMKDTFDIEFKTLEPFNESYTDYWGAYGVQEGCHFDLTSQVSLVRVLRERMRESDLNTVISASDESILSSSISGIKEFLASDSVADMLEQWNTHTYGGSNIERVNLRDLVLNAADDKTFWMSETGSGGDGIQGNLSLMQRMFNDLNYMNVAAWLDWQVMENSDQWGLIKTSQDMSFDDDENIVVAEDMEVVKNLYVHMQVTRFIKQGYTMLSSGNSKVLTALSPDSDSLIIVALNNTSSENEFNFDLSLFSSVGSAASLYVTDETYDCEQQSDITISNNMISYTAGAYSIATFIVPVTAGTGITTIEEDIPYWIQVRASSTVMKSTCSGIMLVDADVTSKNQQWYFNKLDNGNYRIYVLDSIDNQYAITETDDYYLTLEVLDESNSSQEFAIDSVGDGCVLIRSASTGKALDQESSSTSVQTRIGFNTYETTDYDNACRHWRLLHVPSTDEELVSEAICTGTIETQGSITDGYFELPWTGEVECTAWTVPSGDPKIAVSDLSAGDTLAIEYTGPDPVLILIGENSSEGIWVGWFSYPQANYTSDGVAYYIYDDVIAPEIENFNDTASVACTKWSLSIINWGSSCDDGDTECIEENTTIITAIYLKEGTGTGINNAEQTADLRIVDNIIYSEGIITLYNMSGQLIGNGENEFDTSVLSTGFYVISCKAGSYKIEVK